MHPLLRLHGDSYTIAPLSVLVDPPFLINQDAS